MDRKVRKIKGTSIEDLLRKNKTVNVLMHFLPGMFSEHCMYFLKETST